MFLKALEGKPPPTAIQNFHHDGPDVSTRSANRFFDSPYWLIHTIITTEIWVHEVYEFNNYIKMIAPIFDSSGSVVLQVLFQVLHSFSMSYLLNLLLY